MKTAVLIGASLALAQANIVRVPLTRRDPEEVVHTILNQPPK